MAGQVAIGKYSRVWRAVVERVGGLAMAESSGNTEVVRCVVVQIGGAVSEQYGVRRRDGCTSA